LGVQSHGDANRGDAHGGAVGGAGGARFLGRDAGQDGGDGALGRGAEQIERAARGHVALPADQGSGQLAWVDRTLPLDQQPAKQDGLLGVVGDRARGQARGDRVAGGAGSKPVSSPPQRSAISRRESICVGMPSASPMASPYSAPRARKRVSVITKTLIRHGVVNPS
jgi:hypothetical protein